MTTDDFLRDRFGLTGATRNSVPAAEDPATRKIKALEAELARLWREADESFWRTPVRTATVVQPQPIDCQRCQRRPAWVERHPERGNDIYLYVRSRHHNGPICQPCEDELSRAHAEFWKDGGC
jgi:hypothetical protein